MISNLDNSRHLDVAVPFIVLVTGVSFNTPALGTAAFELQIRIALQGILVGVAFLLLAARPESIQRSSRATRALSSLALFAVLSTLWSFDPLRSLTEGVTTLALVVVISVHAMVRSWERTRWLLSRSMLVCVAAGAIVELVLDDRPGRWAGLATSPTELAQFAVLAAALVMLGTIQQLETRLFTVTAVLGLGVIVVLSQSRVAFAVLCVLTALTCWLRAPRANRMATAVALTAACFSLAITAQAFLSSFVLRDDVEVGELSSFTGRSSIWSLSVDLFRQRTMFGWGFGSGGRLWAQQVMAGRANWFPSHAHQVFLELAVSLGLVGLGLLLWLIVAVARARRGNDGASANILLGTVLALGATEPMVHRASSAIVILALAAAIVRGVEASPSRVLNKRRSLVTQSE